MHTINIVLKIFVNISLEFVRFFFILFMLFF